MLCVTQGASEQLQRGVAHLRERLGRNRRFYADLAQLQRDWNIQVENRNIRGSSSVGRIGCGFGQEDIDS